MGLGPSKFASRPVNEREGRDSCPSTTRRSPRPRFKCQQIGLQGSRKIPGFCRGLFQTTLEVRGGFAARGSHRRFSKKRRDVGAVPFAPAEIVEETPDSQSPQFRDPPIPRAGLLHGVQGILAQNLAEADQESVAFPIRNPQSAIRNPPCAIRRSAAIRRISISCRTSSMPRRREKGLEVSGGGKELGLESGGSGEQGMFSSGKSCEESRPGRSLVESLGVIYFRAF